MFSKLVSAAALAAFASIGSAEVPEPSEAPELRPTLQTLEGTGENPVCFMADLPMTNTLWQSGIDGSLVPGARQGLMWVSTRAVDGGLSSRYGELLVDPGPRFVTLLKPFIDNRAHFGIPIPDDPALLGETFYAQALVLGSTIQLTNGIELTVGSGPAPAPGPDVD